MLSRLTTDSKKKVPSFNYVSINPNIVSSGSPIGIELIGSEDSITTSIPIWISIILLTTSNFKVLNNSRIG